MSLNNNLTTLFRAWLDNAMPDRQGMVLGKVESASCDAALAKGEGEWLDQTVNPWGPNIIENKGSRSIYVIFSDSPHVIQEIRPGRAAQGKIDGAVDVIE